MDIVAGSAKTVAAAGAAYSAVKKNLKRKTPEQVQKALDGSFRAGEMIERKRVAPVTFRLHPAKYLQMDKLLKSLFFPLKTLRNHFGLMSYTDVNRKDAEDLLGIQKDVAGIMRTKGTYRGLALFSVRDTAPWLSPVSANALNADPKLIGKVNKPGVFEGNVDTIYRAYHNGPSLSDGTGGAVTYDGSSVIRGATQVLTDVDSADQSQVRDLSMGINLAHIEKSALNGMCYADPVVANGRLAVPAAPVANQDNTELIPGQSSIQSYQNSPFVDEDDGTAAYNYQVANGVVRIVDGSLCMDIMNTENTPCVVEVVIHAKKKNNLTKQSIYNQFINDYERLYAASGLTSSYTASDANAAGGWQTLYDPEVPLLKLPKSSEVYSYVTEVHRSHHILAPGQSKLVTIKLGNLWYKISNKNDLLIGGDFPNKKFTSHEQGAGTLFVAIGHSGFNTPQGIQAVLGSEAPAYPQAFMTPETSYPADAASQMRGTGWWAGMTHAPSSIVLSGNYQETFYPMTFDRSEGSTTAGFINRAAVFQAYNDPLKRAVIPPTHILPEKIVTADSTFKSNVFREEL